MNGIKALAYAAFGLTAGYFLITGFRTGTMRCFWSLALQGDASRKQNRVWFRFYAGLNVVIVVLCGLAVLMFLTETG